MLKSGSLCSETPWLSKSELCALKTLSGNEGFVMERVQWRRREDTGTEERRTEDTGQRTEDTGQKKVTKWLRGMELLSMRKCWESWGCSGEQKLCADPVLALQHLPERWDEAFCRAWRDRTGGIASS